MNKPMRRSSDLNIKDKMYFYLAVICGVLMFTGLVSDSWGEALAEAGVKQSLYEDSPYETSFQGNFGVKEWPVYGLVSYESAKIRMVGQPVAETDILSVGLGVSKPFGKWSVFMEGGFAFLDVATDQHIADEVVYTELVGNHAVEGRPVPVSGPNRGDYTTSYEAADAPFVRVGLSYQLWDNVALRGSYRFLEVSQEYTLKDKDWRGGGYWREDTQLGLSAAEIGIWYTF